MAVIQKDRIVVEARSRQDLETQLELGTKSLAARACELGDRGILVTRLSPSDYVIELDPRVPFGMTVECCRWAGRGDWRPAHAS